MTNETISIAVALLQLGSTVYYIHRSRTLREADSLKAEVGRLTLEVGILKALVKHALPKLGVAIRVDD